MAHPRPAMRSNWLIRLAQLFLTLAFPVVTVLTGIRLVATEAFIQFEYNRPGFPADRFGFTTAERLEYAPYAIKYLRSDRGIEYLAQLTFDDGLPLYNERELRHMEDVKVVMRVAFQVHLVMGILYVIGIIALARRRPTRAALRRGLSGGGVFTIALTITLIVLIFANWDYFFDTFHAIFFAGDTWLFRTSDTLIRLFPEQFWFDAAMVVGSFTLLVTLSAIGSVWYWERQLFLHPPAAQDGTRPDPVPQLAQSSVDVEQ